MRMPIFSLIAAAFACVILRAAEVNNRPVYLFDKTIERELALNDSRMLDLDTSGFVADLEPPASDNSGDLFTSPLESDSRVRYARNMALLAFPGTLEALQPKPAEILKLLDSRLPDEQSRLAANPDQVWLFRTASGKSGVMELTHQAGAVLVRYKLIRPRKEFAPLLTAQLRAGEEDRFLNLEDGKLYPAAPEAAPFAYIQNLEKFGWCVTIEPWHNYHTDPERGARQWESMAAEEIAEPPGLGALPMERKGFYRLKPGTPPQVILIPGFGLVRVLDVQEKPLGPAAKIEIKKVALPKPSV